MKYIISLKHTHKDDKVLTFWRENANGYCYRKDWIGRYEDNDINCNNHYYNDKKDTFTVDCDIIDKLWIKYQLGKEQIEAVPSTVENLSIIGITRQMLIEKTAYDFSDLVETVDAIIAASSREYLLGYIDAIINLKNKHDLKHTEISPNDDTKTLREQNETLGLVYMDITCSCGNHVTFKSADDIPQTNLKCTLCQKVYLIRYVSQ